MTQLKKYLRRLPKEEYEDAVEYFEEYFGEADEKGQQELIAELGTPKEAARELIANLLDKRLEEPEILRKPIKNGTFKIALLGLCAAPIAIPLLLALIAVLVSVAICMFLVYVCMFIFSFCCFLVGGKFLIRGCVSFPFSTSGAFILIGVGIFGIGCGILLAVLGIYLCKWTCVLFVRIAQKIIRKRRR